MIHSSALDLTEVELERELERHVKRLDPLFTIFYTGHHHAHVRDDAHRFTQAVPHVVARIVESTCAYHRSRYAERLDWRHYARLHNLLSQHSSEFDTYALTTAGDVDLFGQRAFREQMVLQYSPDLLDYARLESLYCSGRHSSALDRFFRDITGIDLSFYVGYAALIHSNMTEDNVPGFSIDRGTQRHGGPISDAQVQAFLHQMAYTVREVGAEYRRRRSEIEKPYLRCFARWVLLDRPLVLTDHGVVVTPFPHLVIDCTMRRPFELLQEADSDARRLLDDAFEDHVGRWLGALATHVGGRLSQPDKAERDEHEPRCDFMLDASRFVLLVECKTVFHLPLFLTQSALGQSNLAQTLGQAFRQLDRTRARLCTGTKPVFAVVVTPFELPFPNSEWFISRTAGVHVDLAQLQASFGILPQVLCSHDWEYLLSVSLATDLSIDRLFNDKRDADYAAVGDWRTFLDDIRKGQQIPHPTMARELAEALRTRASSLANPAAG